MANCLYEDLRGQGNYGLKIYHRDAKKKMRETETPEAGAAGPDRP